MGKLIRKKTTGAKKKKQKDSGSQKKIKDVNQVGAKADNQSAIAVKSTVAKRSTQIGVPSAKQKSNSKIKIAFIENSVQFLREVKVELKKVAWPTRKQTLGSTVVVLVLVFMIAFFLGIVDIGLASLIKIVL